MNEISRADLIHRLKTTRSWKELGMTPKDVCAVIEADSSAVEVKGVCLHSEDGERACSTLKMRESELQEQLDECKKKIERLTATNKQLRAENKALKVEARG